MSFDYTVFDVTVTPLTPLHIGSGETLLQEYDFHVMGNITYRLNQDAILTEQEVADPQQAELLARTPPAQLLDDKRDYHAGSRFIRYRLAGRPRSKREGAELREQIKTVRNEAYLPGSSLKGAIRTALTWHGWAEQRLSPQKTDLEGNPKYAGRRLEQQLMGRDPNHDLLRALQVSDSAPTDADCFMVLNAQVMMARGLGSPIEVEAIRPDTPFHLTMKIDTRLLGDWAGQNQLRLGGNPTWLTALPQYIQAHTRQRLESGWEWFKKKPDAKQAAGLYRQLLGVKLPENSCLLQIGWGTGWGGKTYGSRLQANGPLMEFIISKYRLARGRRNPGDAFPKSRRVAVSVAKDPAGKFKPVPGLPLGWVLMELKERDL
ncbi:MAG: type III-A CRISPR-associated RAMP protein Csm5 [Chloroflexota bacterium]